MRVWKGTTDPHAERTSSTTDPRCRSKRPRTERRHIPTIVTPVELERQAALHAGPRRAADPASSSSAASLPGSAANPLSGGPHATNTRPREPVADQRPGQGAGGQPPPQLPNRQATEGTSQQPGHNASGPRADAEMTGTSGPQESAGPLPAATPCSVPQQQEPSTGTCLGDTLAPPHGTPPRLAQRWTRTGWPCPPRPPDRRSKGARVPSTTRN